MGDFPLEVGAELTVLSETVRIAAHACAQLAQLERVVLPCGLTDIGESAFRGCTRLHTADLPQTLRHIGSGAFACTSLRRVRIPASCVELDAEALNTGTALGGLEATSFYSTLRELSVDSLNPRYTMHGGLLCERGARELRALVCPAQPKHVDLRGVRAVAPSTFAGCMEISTLHVADGTRFEGVGPMLPHGKCTRLLADVEDGATTRALDLEVPSGQTGVSFVKRAFQHGLLDTTEAIALYDEALRGEADQLAQARQMAARLAQPACLAADTAQFCTRTLMQTLESACIQFGARSYWRGFDDLFEAGLITAGNASRLAALLADFGDAAASAYLLDAKNRRFGQVVWDYGI